MMLTGSKITSNPSEITTQTQFIANSKSLFQLAMITPRYLGNLGVVPSVQKTVFRKTETMWHLHSCRDLCRNKQFNRSLNALLVGRGSAQTDSLRLR